MELALTFHQLAALLKSQRESGNCTRLINKIASLKSAQPGDLSFLGNAKYKLEVAETSASVVILPLEYVGEPKPDQVFIFVENPSAALAMLCSRMEQLLWPKPAPGIHPSAVVSPEAWVASTATIGPGCVIEAGAVIGERCHLQAQVFIGRKVSIGADCWLMPRVVVAAECRLGDRVRLQPGVVVGSDGFGYEVVAGRHEKIPQVGNVVIEDDVEIGANTTLDRARFSQTVIGVGTKIDNLVQIAHNVVVGKHCLICAQVGISGSTTIEDYVIIGGQAGLAGHLTVGRGAKIDGQSGVNTDLPPNTFVKGSPCLPYNLEQRVNVVRKRLPELFRKVDALEAELKKSSSAG